MPRRLLIAILLLAVVGGGARADDDPGAEAPAAEPGAEPAAAAELLVGVIQGSRVNLRVGPRVDIHPVTQLDDGAVVLVVATLGEWMAVRVPAGFPAAVSTDYAVPEGPDVLRVTTGRLNLRVHPPEPGGPVPGMFEDRPVKGALLPLIEIVDVPEEPDAPHALRSSGWAWVVAPEEVRAFVHARYVKVLGPVAEYEALVDAARAKRVAEVTTLRAARRAAAARITSRLLMEAVGTVQQDLYRLRQAGGTDKAPLVALANRMDEALEAAGGGEVTGNVQRLARALREDLEREIQLRVARHDAEVAKARGLTAPAVPTLEPVETTATAEGEVRYEPTPGWEEDGVYFLFRDGQPVFVLRLGMDYPLPHPDFARHAGGGTRRVTGRRPGTRLFGLPIFEVESVAAIAE